MDYLAEAKKIINTEYQEKYALAHTDYQTKFMDEKIKHSYQVLGAGNYLLKHEPTFQNISREQLTYYQGIVLLHDVRRFYEILEKEKGNFIDHGVSGADFLSQTTLFNKNDALLAIKHHGHLIEELYEDCDFKNLPASEQEHIKKISFLVRDADKIANLYLLSNNFEKMRGIFFVEQNYPTPHKKSISPQVLTDFTTHRSIKKADIKSIADHALLIIAWLYDINYISSFVFLEKLHILKKLFNFFSCYWRLQDYALFTREIETFIHNKKSAT